MIDSFQFESTTTLFILPPPLFLLPLFLLPSFLLPLFLLPSFLSSLSPFFSFFLPLFVMDDASRRKRSRQKTERKFGAVLLVDLNPTVCFVTELLKVSSVPRRFGRWGPALFFSLAAYLRQKRVDVSSVHLITRHQHENDGTCFDSTFNARKLFDRLGFVSLQVRENGGRRRKR